MLTAEDGDPAARNRRRSRSTVLLREIRSVPTLLLVLVCLVVGMPLAIVLTPDQQVTVAGQQLSVGARTPGASLSGPAQLVQLGNTEFDVGAVRVYGPLRPRLTLGPVRRGATLDANADTPSTVAGVIGDGFLRWYAWATVVLLGFTLAASAVSGCVRLLLTLRRLDAGERDRPTVLLWRRSARQLSVSAAVAVTLTMLAWAAAGALAYDGAAGGLRRIRSLSDLVGTYHLSPSPVGPAVRGFTGAVIGDSRAARLGGPPLADATEDDAACGRSGDSLAVEIGNLTGTRVRNLACSGASIAQGLRGPLAAGGRLQPPQVGLLKQVQDLRYVVVVVGPNDLYWGDFLRYCYGVANCGDNLSQGEFALRLASFDRDYGLLLQDLNDLPGKPRVVVMASYDVFDPDADCPDAKGPDGVPGLSPANLRLLADMNRQLNEVLTAGAEKYRFTVATPRLSTLCQPASPRLGRDLQGLEDSHPFHPTAIGIVRMAAAVTQVIGPQPGD
jgi:lysophospholipase L1-like esterase